jgi:hypothetical protein
MTKTVQVYDLTTKKLSSIPASELAPGMIEAVVAGIGLVWVAAANVQIGGPYRHPPFTENIRQRLRRIKASLDEVFPKTLEAWEDGFRKDLYPRQEIAIWLHIASTYQRCTATRALTPQQRRDYFQVIMACSTGPREQVFEVVQLAAISRQEAERAVELYYLPNK